MEKMDISLKHFVLQKYVMIGKHKDKQRTTTRVCDKTPCWRQKEIFWSVLKITWFQTIQQSTVYFEFYKTVPRKYIDISFTIPTTILKEEKQMIVNRTRKEIIMMIIIIVPGQLAAHQKLFQILEPRVK